MEPLRERKKEQTRARILEVAERLLGERGLEAATMEEIAAAAEVSVGTLYNYFGSKTLLLLALYEQETAILIARGAPVVAEPGDDGPAAVRRLFGIYLDVLVDQLDRSLLTDALTAGLNQAALGGKLMDLDLRLMEQVGQLAMVLQARGLLDAAVAPEEAALLLYSILITQILFYVTVPAVAPGVVRAQLVRQVEAAFAGLGPDPTQSAGRS